MQRPIYLDNSAIARPSERALADMWPYFVDEWGVSSAPHQWGQRLNGAVTSAYQAIYRALNAQEEDDFILTSSGAEAVNQIFLSTYFEVVRQSGKNHLLVGRSDEAPAILAMGRLEQLGCAGKMIALDHQGQVTPKALVESLTPRTSLLSLSWANGLTGVVQPIESLAPICHERGVLLHLEASHALGRLPLNLKEIRPAFVSFDGAPLHAPKGTGGLLKTAATPLQSLIVGGLEQGGYRAGALNVPMLVALGSALQEDIDARDFVGTEVARLRDRLEQGLLTQCGPSVAFYRDVERLPHVTVIGFPGVVNEALLYALDRKGVYASIGGGNFQQIGLLLEASGVDSQLAHASISFSLSRETTDAEIDKTIEIVRECLQKLRKVSTVFFSDQKPVEGST